MSKKLSISNLANLNTAVNVHLPAQNFQSLPEKVLQFGTGVLLRGLPDYYIDMANRAGVFNGRVLVVKSTTSGGTAEFDSQDSLYTIAERGLQNENKVENFWINSSISRVLSAHSHWQEILKASESPDMQIVISNTTEVGIELMLEKLEGTVPVSFPGKLLSFLYNRYRYFNGATEAGMVILPTELLTDNGSKLKSIVLELAGYNELDPAFTEWINESNYFCNTLVDRIVPGKMPKYEAEDIFAKLGYEDALMISAEPFNLWAIESAEPRVREILSFSEVNEGMIIAESIEKFRELKLRLLNGTHSFSCGLAYLAGYNTVKEALGNEQFSAFIRRLMMLEIAKIFPQDLVSYNEACAFASNVMDRFRNPFLEHKWLSISMNYTSKMRMRNIPLLARYSQRHGEIPVCMAMGFAAYILFMKCEEKNPGEFVGKRGEMEYIIQDESAPFFAKTWKQHSADTIVQIVGQEESLWGMDLTKLQGWEESITRQLKKMLKDRAFAVLCAELN